MVAAAAVVTFPAELRAEDPTAGTERFHTIAETPPAFTIPVIDLAADIDRQVIIDREEGQYLGHPTTVLLEDNRTMICVYPKGHGVGGIVMKRSDDGGLTWSDRLPTPESWATSREVPTSLEFGRTRSLGARWRARSAWAFCCCDKSFMEVDVIKASAPGVRRETAPAHPE